jgi:putative oxidoreductase
MQKIFGILAPAELSKHPIEVGSQLWFGGLIELVGGLAIAFGVFTVWAAFICSGTMAVAYIQYHWKLKFDSQFFPAVNQGEPAVVYSILFLYIACRGPGRLSWDKR